MPKLLVDDRWNEGGIQRFFQELIRRIDPKFSVKGLKGGWHLRRPLSPLNPWWMAQEIRKQHPDVFWSPGFMSPISSPVPFVFTVHDLIHARSVKGVRAAYFRSILRPLCKKAYKIVTVSEFSRHEVADWAGLPLERVVRIYNAVSSHFTTEGSEFAPGWPYLLYVGAHRTHKNLHRVIEAFSRSGLSSESKLLLSGEPNQKLRAIAAQYGVSDSVRFAGFIPEDELPMYYRGARALMMLSVYEGFGIPALEAMACGTAVLASNTTSLPEVVGDAALSVNPMSVEEIAHGMRKIVHDEDLRADLVRKGLQRCRLFEWDASARALSNLLLEAAESGRSSQEIR